VHDTIRAAPLPISKTAPAAAPAGQANRSAVGGVKSAVAAAATGARKVVWGTAR
jgi:hypothetical protein